MTGHIRDGGVWRSFNGQGDGIWVKVGGTWRLCSQAWVKVGGTWRSFYVYTPVDTGGGVGGTCFLPFQRVLMADGSWQAIETIKVGDQVQGRWGVNTVRGIEKPLLGTRHMVLINGVCFNTPDHPQWTETGWQVADRAAYIVNDWECQFELHDDQAGKTWIETYTPCHPDDMGQLKPGRSRLAVPGGGFEDLESLVVQTNFPPGTMLYALALDACRTMYVDGYCFSGWADVNKVDYASKIGT